MAANNCTGKPDRRTEFCRQQANISERTFEETGNALYAWHAITMALAGDVAIPPASRKYLQRVAQALGSQGMPSESISRHVMRALELNTAGGPSKFSQRGNDELQHSMIRDAANRTTKVETLPDGGWKRVPDPSKDFVTELETVTKKHGRKDGVESIKRRARRT